MDINIEYIKIRKKDYSSIYNLMKNLDDWFDENALMSIEIDLQFQRGYVALHNENVIGFISYFVYEAVANIAWIAVDTKWHNKKIGTKLISLVENDLKKLAIHDIQVYTLSDSVDYRPYEATRAFYYHYGFKEYRRVKTGNSSCPEELYLRRKF